MTAQRYQDGEVVVDTAKIGCCYAQANSTNTNVWDVRRLRFEHNHGEKQEGGEVAHNHDCVKNINILKFKECHSPFYLDALSQLKKVYPNDEDYANGYNIAYNNQFADGGGGGATTPPCVLAVLDTWFEYSDIQISKQYSSVEKAMLMFESTMDSKVTKMKDWALKEISKKISEYSKGLPIANPSNASKKEDSYTAEEQAQIIAAQSKLIAALPSIEQLYDNRKNLIKKVDSCWDKILIFKNGYQTELKNLGRDIETYVRDWKTALENAEMDLRNKNYTDFFDYYSKIYTNAKNAAEGMLNWEEEAEYALLTSSFLICKCGGKIEFVSSGQQHALYCNKLFNQFVILLQNAANYFQYVLETNIVFGGVLPEESDASAASTAVSLLNIKSSFDNNSEFILADGTKAIELRFITKGYNAEKEKKQSAIIGMLVLTPMVAAATSIAGPIAGVAVSACTWGFDAYVIGSQDREEQDENSAEDLNTVLVDTVDLGSNIASFGIDGVSRPGAAMKAISAIGTPLTVIGYFKMLTDIFYTSDEDWIQEIEITVFTTYMAHIIKQKYKENVEVDAVFDGRTMIRTKSKVDYSAESLKTINWDELGGVSVAVDTDYKIRAEEQEKQTVTNPDQLQEVLKDNTNGAQK